MILALKTDQPEAEILILSDTKIVATYRWQAHRELSNTIVTTIEDQLDRAGASLQELEGIIVFQGPGSFTGLRIGITTANTLAYSLQVPVVGVTEDQWPDVSQRLLKSATVGQFVQPLYGGAPTITQQKK